MRDDVVRGRTGGVDGRDLPSAPRISVASRRSQSPRHRHDAGRSWQADRSPGVTMSAHTGRLGADTRRDLARQRSHVLQARAQATQVRPDTKPTDLRRLAAATLSAVVPGLGQLFNRRPRLAALFLVPSLVVIGIGLLLVQLQSPARLAAWAVSPQVLSTLLALNVIALVWRLVAVGQAFLDTR